MTSGARDRTCRWWKVEEEVQLVFRGGGKTTEKKVVEEEEEEDVDMLLGEKKRKTVEKGKGREFVEGSLDVVCMLDDQHFLSGGDSG